MGLIAIDHVQIAMPVGGEAEARRFFGEVLGLNEIPKPADMALRGGCWFVIGDRQLHLGVEADFRPAMKAHVALSSDDLVALSERLVLAGFKVRQDVPVGSRSRFFSADPFGNRIEFVAA
nr:VOC family protein [Polymorphobacter sp.]